jgi:hypothetical protein
MIGGRKVAGAAQRRTRRGLLQQGSIQGIAFGSGLANDLPKHCRQIALNAKPGDQILIRARELAQQKYGTTPGCGSGDA